MSVTTMTARAFNQLSGRAQKAAKNGPVIITDRGEPSLVLMTIEEYRKITAGRRSLADMLAHPASAYFDFDPPRMSGPPQPPFEFD